MLKKRLLKITIKLSNLLEISRLSIEDLEFLRDILNKNIEDILIFETHELIDALKIIIDSNSNNSIKELYNLGNSLHHTKIVKK